MKTNEAPEKIYLSDFTDTTEPVFYVKQDNTKKTDIEYTRTDVFIEKVEEYLYKQLNDGCMECSDIVVFIEKFRNYMKGE